MILPIQSSHALGRKYEDVERKKEFKNSKEWGVNVTTAGVIGKGEGGRGKKKEDRADYLTR